MLNSTMSRTVPVSQPPLLGEIIGERRTNKTVQSGTLFMTFGKLFQSIGSITKKDLSP